MMRNYKVTVNGTTYEVGVEEVGGAAEVKSIQTVASAPVQKVTPAAKTAPAPKPAAPAAAKTPSGNAENVLAPLPGMVLDIKVKPGDTVKAEQVILIFEAMKMENEIVAPCAGTVKEVFVAKGDILDNDMPVVSIA